MPGYRHSSLRDHSENELRTLFNRPTPSLPTPRQLGTSSHPRWFEQPPWQVPMTVDGSAHHYVVASHFVENQVRFERAAHYKGTPLAETRMNETATRPKLWVLAEKLAGRFHRGEVTLGHLPTRVDYIPIELPLQVRNESIRFLEAHDAGACVRARTRSRMASKSALVRGVTGWSAASNNQASNSGVTSRGFCCCSRIERMTSFTNSLGSAQTPERTWCRRKSSTSVARTIVMVEEYRPSLSFASETQPRWGWKRCGPPPKGKRNNSHHISLGGGLVPRNPGLADTIPLGLQNRWCVRCSAPLY